MTLRKTKISKFLMLALVLFFGIFGVIQLFNTTQTASALEAADPSTIVACAGNPECFAFSVDTRLTETGDTTGTSTTFAVPVSGYVNGAANHTYNWTVNWGDGTETTHSGTGSTTSAGISHTYPSAGQYQITIRPATAAATGWFNAFGFYGNTSGANADANKYMFRSIDTPFTNLMRTQGSSYRFANIFAGADNGTEIPSNLFANISTAGDTDFTSMFYDTFSGYAYNSTTATIPGELFDSLDTSSGTDFEGMFVGTFTGCASSSIVATIPAGLFDSIDTSSGIDFSNMFDQTFSWYASTSTVATIPAGLFDSIDTNSGTNFSFMFYYTFGLSALNSTVATIPVGLFDSIDTSSGTNFYEMFGDTFYFYAESSTVATIPAGLFDSLDTSGHTDFGYMFSRTFSGYAYNSTAATIPAGLLDSIDTSSGTNFSYMFWDTFSRYARNSTTGTIPAGLFDSIDTSNGIDFDAMFSGTFEQYAYNSTVGTIPAGLFDSIDTSRGTGFFAYMFSETFHSYAYNSTVGTIPAGLFDSIDTSRGVVFKMFNGTFAYYARRSASFVVGGSVVATDQFQGPYATKIGPTGTPSYDPVADATTGSQVIPTYDATVRSISAPGGVYAGYDWYRTDGTSCIVASPTPDCGEQNATTLVVFPNDTEWIETTLTSKGNVRFYSLASIAPPDTGWFGVNAGTDVARQSTGTAVMSMSVAGVLVIVAGGTAGLLRRRRSSQ